ncbi:SusD/RagB family nutrient-binding outer membrane lipoprotein [uncultured Parabacteroides sp.]|uniref:SusD/RagB family nutrient-binding outer membrane lipoprotein n=1 Tax=uncultured Parabacteroides sp. TaxID=512312 RepID=UPI00259108C2|nr:SusD/RagB family nutrient-binding outer membrane lipoprotein [uncultured Parabacteroides sp.]
MKRLNLLYTGLVSCMLLSTTACSDYLDINDNPNYPAEVSYTSLLPSGVASTVAVLGSSYELYGGMWSQHYMQGQTSNQYNTICNYSITNSAESRMWSIPYSIALPDLDLVIKQAEEDGAWNYWAVAKVMTAFTYHILVDTYGSIPFTEALKADDGIVSPKFDDSKTIVYPGLIAMLDEVIGKSGELSGTSLPALSTQDYIFGSSKGTDMSKWISFAKSLKLKLLMRDFDANKAAIQALLSEDDLLTVDAKMDLFMDLENKSNPLYENDRRKLNTKNNIRACATLCEYMKKYDDPRLSDFFNPNEDGTGTTPLKCGDRPTELKTNQVSIVVLEATDPVYLMSASEIAFLKAEAYARLNDTEKAKNNYNQGVKLAFERWGKDASSFTAEGGAYAFDSKDQHSMLKSILTQKWIASTRCQAWDAWFDINRTGIPALGATFPDEENYVWGELTPCVGSALGAGEYPRRMLYPKGSSDYNSNTPVVVPLQEKQWWHK